MLSRAIGLQQICFVALCVVLATVACAAEPPEYLKNVDSALAALEVGKTAESVDSLKKAIGFNANDSLAHTAMGLTLLMGGRRDDALAEFNLAVELDASCAEALYGRALVNMGKREYGLAISGLCDAQTRNTELAMGGSIEYAKYLASGTCAEIADPGKDASMLVMKAMALTKADKYGGALAIWRELQPGTVRSNFGERIGCSMTFLDSKPITLTGIPLKTGYKASGKAKDKGPTVSGSVLLRADLSKAPGVKLVSFFVDNKLVGLTNHSPYSYSWDTQRAPNGAHMVKIQGADEYGTILTEKTTHVVVKNAGSAAPSARVAGDEAARVWSRLWGLMKLGPSAVAVNYNMALCAEAGGDKETAEAALERVMAIDPDYMDAANRLAKLYGSDGKYDALYKGASGEKRIALTFDDGPKEHSGQLLDALKKAGVSATFFVVGTQVEKHPEILKRIAEEGHDIQNHTYNHRDLELLPDREIQQELFRNIALVRSITGKSMRFVRPPGGHEGRGLRAVTSKFGMPTVFWSSNCGKLEGTTKKKMYDYLVSSAEPGGIVLMHNAEIVTLNALPDFISTLRERGYSFVTVSELTSK